MLSYELTSDPVASYITPTSGLQAIWVVLESTDFLMEGIVVASLDETMQCFVPGRGSSVRNVLIDTAGVLPGVLILYGIVFANEKMTGAFL